MRCPPLKAERRLVAVTATFGPSQSAIKTSISHFLSNMLLVSLLLAWN